MRFAGRLLRRSGPDGGARLGIAHVPEGRGTFSELTVWENLRLGAYTRRGRIRDRDVPDWQRGPTLSELEVPNPEQLEEVLKDPQRHRQDDLKP